MLKTLITILEGRLGSWLRYLYYSRQLKSQNGYFSSEAGFYISGADKVSIGSGCAFNRGVIIAADKEIIIDNWVMIGAYTLLRDSDHGFSSDALMRSQAKKMSSIRIANNVWIGAHCCILKGTIIGEGSVIGANSLVKHNLKGNCVYVGSPVRLLKRRG
jgi:acetyltransferase-like isoleucine patch superfamily enzyme